MEGFKSYVNEERIKDLDPSFTAITGMNGSGKSNIIDAVAFALNLTTGKHMRVNSLKELINIHKKECQVALVFNNKDKAKSPSGYQSFDFIEISRHMDIDGKSKYRLNGHSCSKGTIERICQSIGITSNFVIMQGHITKLLSMKSEDLKKLIEEMAGTRNYNQEQEKAFSNLLKKETRLKESQEYLKRNIEPHIKELKREKGLYEEGKDYEKKKTFLLDEFSQIQTQIERTNINTLFRDLKKNVKTYVQSKKELDAVKKRIKNAEIDNTSIDILDLKNNILHEEIFLKTLANKNNGKNIEELKLELEKLLTEKDAFQNIHKLNEMKHKEKIMSESIAKSIGGFKDIEKIQRSLSQKYASIPYSLDNLLQITKELESFEFNSSILLSQKKYNSDIERLQDKSLLLDTDIKDFSVKSLYLDLLHLKEKQYFSINSSEIAISELNDRYVFLSEKFSKLKILYDLARRIVKKYSTTEKKIEDLKEKISYPLIDGILGTVDENFTLKNEKYKYAIYTAIGGKLKHIICKDDQIASKVLNYKRSEKKIVCIPLNKIAVSPAKDVKPNNGISAIETLEINKNTEKAFKHLLNGVFVFENTADAKEHCFKHKIVSITLDGIVYNPRGTLTGGLTKIKEDVIKMGELKSLKTQLEVLEMYLCRNEEIDTLSEYIKKMELFIESFRSFYEMRSKLEIVERSCSVGSDIHKDLRILRDQILELSIQDKKRRINDEKIKKLSEEIEAIEREERGREREIDATNKKIREYYQVLEKGLLSENRKRETMQNNDQLELEKQELMKKVLKIKGMIIEVVDNLKEHKTAFERLTLEINRGCEDVFYTDQNDDESRCIFREFQIVNSEEDRIDIEFLGLNENIFSRLGEEIEDKKTIKEYNKRLKEIKEELNKKPNAPKLSPSTFELLERNIAIINDLEKKIEQLMKDKENIMKSMKEFSRLETQETKKAFRYLNENLGRFLRYFIQNSEALITEEYELKIRIKAWKNSLSELSGGQRSIVALCIIFTMLTYRAAPFYIFDEIDAALDINYTQGIGEIIKKEFKNAQFLIISLKNNMFENANRILRVYLQDQVTKVCRIK